MAISRILLLLICVALPPSLCYAAAHPVSVDSQSHCLECHAEQAAAEHVHAAVKQGCTACHSVEERDGATYIALKPTKSVVCFECHQLATLSQTHFPYASGMCTRCHDPHGSANRHLLPCEG